MCFPVPQSSSHRYAYGCLNVCLYVCECARLCFLAGWVPTAEAVGHLSSQSYQQGGCNLAENLIIQIAEYLMVLKHMVKKKLYYLFTPYSVTSIHAAPGGRANKLYPTHVLNYWLIIYHNSCHLKRNNALQDLATSSSSSSSLWSSSLPESIKVVRRSTLHKDSIAFNVDIYSASNCSLHWTRLIKCESKVNTWE